MKKFKEFVAEAKLSDDTIKKVTNILSSFGFKNEFEALKRVKFISSKSVDFDKIYKSFKKSNDFDRVTELITAPAGPSYGHKDFSVVDGKNVFRVAGIDAAKNSKITHVEVTSS